MKLFAALAAVCAIAAAEPSITYVKAFPASNPPWVSVQLSKDCSGVFRDKADDPEDTVEFELAPEECDEIFALAAKLDHFKRPLESGLKVANMGKKTFRWEDGAEKQETSFNYSLDESGRALHDWFEKITETQYLHFDLERTAKFDRLGVNRTLLQLEAAWDRKRLVGCERFLPLLDRVARNDGYLNMARERAAVIAAAIRSPKPKASE